VGETSEAGRAELRLCNLVAQSEPNAERGKEEFNQEVEKELTGRTRNRGRSSISNLCQSQMPVIEGTIETSPLMLGADRSRGCCRESICVDFLAGANLDKWRSGDFVVLNREGSSNSFPENTGRDFSRG
jgi:hypothetical protein